MEPLQRRYALAKAWVSDETEAGELFMRARSEAHLLALVNRWRAEQGFTPLTQAEFISLAPHITADEAEEARRLLERSRRRSRLHAAFAVSAAVLLWLTFWVGLSRSRTVHTVALDSDPSFGGQPLVTASTSARTLSVYRVEATDGSIWVWWEGSGAEVAGLAEVASPAISLRGEDGILRQWYTPARTEVTRLGADRVRGRSVYLATEAEQVLVAWQASPPPVRTPGPDWIMAAATVRTVPTPGSAKVLKRNDAPGAIQTGSFTLHVASVALTEDFTRVDLHNLPRESTLSFHGLACLAVGDVLYAPVAERTSGQVRSVYFSPLPADTSVIDVTLPVVHRIVIDAEEFLDPAVDGAAPSYRAPLGSVALFPFGKHYGLDAQGNRYELIYRSGTLYPPNGLQPVKLDLELIGRGLVRLPVHLN